MKRLGIDIGSTTVKVAVIDEQHNILFSDYQRHFAKIQETLSSLLKKAQVHFRIMHLRQMLPLSLVVKMLRSFISQMGSINV